MKKCNICGEDIISGEWLACFPSIFNSKNETVMSFNKFTPPIKGEICIKCSWFSINQEKLNCREDLYKGNNACFICGKELISGYWSEFLPIFKKNDELDFIVLNSIENNRKIEVQFCPTCLFFLNKKCECENIKNVNSEKDIEKYFISKSQQHNLFKKYTITWATVCGLISLTISILSFLFKQSAFSFINKVFALFIIGISFMSMGMIVGAFIGIIHFKVKFKNKKR